MKFIVEHPNYESLPNKFKGKQISWVSVSDEARNEWWDDKVKKLSVKDRASVARYIHPKELKGMKPCQTCGKKYIIKATETNPVCKICVPGRLDFEKKEIKK